MLCSGKNSVKSGDVVPGCTYGSTASTRAACFAVSTIAAPAAGSGAWYTERRSTVGRHTTIFCSSGQGPLLFTKLMTETYGLHRSTRSVGYVAQGSMVGLVTPMPGSSLRYDRWVRARVPDRC